LANFGIPFADKKSRFGTADSSRSAMAIEVQVADGLLPWVPQTPPGAVFGYNIALGSADSTRGCIRTKAPAEVCGTPGGLSINRVLATWRCAMRSFILSALLALAGWGFFFGPGASQAEAQWGWGGWRWRSWYYPSYSYYYGSSFYSPYATSYYYGYPAYTYSYPAYTYSYPATTYYYTPGYTNYYGSYYTPRYYYPRYYYPRYY